ncbi:MAG TPA: polysaccharide biosynthesis/export family protein [Bryobacteraceae bacterium]|jgi:polysaccharide export outer membrane protein|nr:polysaccharide biosynthesis/export family protein [Bryobacteraceae bacterium]
MKIGEIQFTNGKIRDCAALAARVFAVVAISTSMTACGLFDGSAVKQKVISHPQAKAADPYQIGSDDELEIIVWTQPQLSGKVTVASDGTIAMPLIGRVPAAGLTPDQLKADLEKRYARYVHGANATVRVSDPASHVFYVLGEVNKPGVFKLHSGEVLSQALAEAGGLGEFADAGKIRILRHKENETVVLTINYYMVGSGGDVSADVPVEPGDTVQVP